MDRVVNFNSLTNLGMKIIINPIIAINLFQLFKKISKHKKSFLNFCYQLLHKLVKGIYIRTCMLLGNTVASDTNTL